MPSKYKKASLNGNGFDIFNAVYADTPALYNSNMPFSATAGAEQSSRAIGNFFYDNVDLANSYISALLNRVALTVVQSKMWEDPWVALEKGKLEAGEIVEEIFIELARPHHYNVERAEREVWKREIPDIKSAFHALNYQEFYKQTIQPYELVQAFNTWDAHDRFVRRIIDQMFTAANYDAYQIKHYLIAMGLLNGFIKTKQIQIPTNDATARSAISIARAESSLMNILNPNYNYFGVPNFTNYDDQVIIITAEMEGLIDVSVLASAFHMDKAEFLSMHKLITAGFGNLDIARLDEIFKEDTTYHHITSAEAEQLNKVPFVIFDRTWFQIYDKVNRVTNIENPEGLYYNYWYHVWKIYGVSPFANALAFVGVEANVTSITVVTPTLTITKGQSAQIVASVQATGFANKDIIYTSDTEGVTVSPSGIVSVSAGTTATSATITLTAKADSTITSSVAITIV